METFKILLIAALIMKDEVFTQKVGNLEIVADWVLMDYDWKSIEQRNAAIADGTFIQKNNIPTGLKVHKDVVYVTVARWLPGVPSTMNTLVFKDGRPLLKPFPNWEMQKIDDCDAFQFTQSMEIVPQTDEMWIIDAGRRDIFSENPINNCPAKIMIFDLTTNKIKHTYTFPDDVLSHTGNFLNDIVVDPERGFAYMSDVGESSSGYKGGLVFYDRNQDSSRRSEHRSMNAEVNREDGGYDININGKPYQLSNPVDGIALSTDKKSVFYCPLGGVHLHQVAASTLRSCDQNVCTLTNAQVRDMGSKVSESDGMVWGHRSLYFAAMSMNAIYRWDHQADMESQKVNDLWRVDMTRQDLVKRDDTHLIWGDTFAFDDKGWLWVIANRVPLFFSGQLDFSGKNGSNFRIAKIFVDDKSYLQPFDNSSSSTESPRFLVILISCIALMCLARL